jgi:hypothetical protein
MNGIAFEASQWDRHNSACGPVFVRRNGVKNSHDKFHVEANLNFEMPLVKLGRRLGVSKSKFGQGGVDKNPTCVPNPAASHFAD